MSLFLQHGAKDSETSVEDLSTAVYWWTLERHEAAGGTAPQRG
jgi:hypothetical protein